ncbi:PhzF family phenazine biosynthesis protein [Olivibacter domesticus]|uniref:Phenazine biosynthesis protein PhzF family n=1 Tax=Olivibacter domesticus TaxID=407022 RepID=A0A1H7KUQ0_OLID1|nr:PhzF family phenazine biosynthesis protein [Olivibacter domesticus]SEK89667.1 phenazine biosynthesis protein PhzF family [Olivibacter domesticus]
MKLTIYQVDAFAEKVFKGNSAAVCPLTEWMSDDILLKIAKENNLAETAFYIVKEDNIEIRWFTPGEEVDLCGHATLAAAFVLKNQENFRENTIPFYSSRSGNLPVSFQDWKYTLNFPADQFAETALTEELLAATDKKPIAAYKGKTDYMLVFEKQEDIETVIPNLSQIAAIKARGIIVTAKGENHDFVSRFFAPAVGVNEDPVTGSAHTTLTPYWAEKLNKNELRAFQLSERGGEIYCRLLNDRVELEGKAVLYLKGDIFI